MGKDRRKEKVSNRMQSVAETVLGSGLLNAMIAKQRCVDHKMEMEAGIFEEAIQDFRTQLTEVGLNPDDVLNRRIELLKKALHT
jgi:hypothetical protein